MISNKQIVRAESLHSAEKEMARVSILGNANLKLIKDR